MTIYERDGNRVTKGGAKVGEALNRDEAILLVEEFNRLVEELAITRAKLSVTDVSIPTTTRSQVWVGKAKRISGGAS